MKEKVAFKPFKRISELAAIIALLLFSVIGGAYISPKIFVLGLIIIIAYVLLLVILRLTKREKNDKKNADLFNNVTIDLLMDMKMPVAILDADGMIIWYNQSFADKSEEKNLYSTNINDLLETRLNVKRLKEQLNGESFTAYLSSTKYMVDSYLVKSSNCDFFITVWDDRTEIDKLQEKLEMTDPVVAYIVIDNSVDATSFIDNSYRVVTAKISGILSEWVSNMNGVLTEFGRDRYIAVFDKSCIKEMVETKFEILDRVRQASADAPETLPVTISIGVACLENITLAEKEQSAHRALDLAIQRGGDQAVLMKIDGNEFYGGRQKPVQKRTKIRSRVVAGQIISLLKQSGNVLIMGHKYADFDSIGSCIGMASFAMPYCDRVNVVVNRGDVAVRQVLEKAERLEKFNDVFIDASTAQDMIQHDTLLIICDVNNPKIFESTEIYENVKNVVVIDHHRKTGEFIIEPAEVYLEPSCSSASEIVAEMIESTFAPGTLSSFEAEVLFAGIVLDTKGFTRNAGMRTFNAAYYLRGEGAAPNVVEEYFKISLDNFVAEAKFGAESELYRDNIIISKLKDSSSAEDKITSARVAERTMQISGISAAFALCKIGDTTHISARSNGKINVQLILEKLNGGGHFESAGAQVSGDSIDNVVETLKQAIDEYLNEINA
ncbi:MAG: DHH family phosphoesterase [Clostridia bacterium]|nr:DHH family phosphoesterase [Clostridia bacterium]